VRLYSNINSAWQFADYTYTAVGSASPSATMTAPPPSSTLSASTVLFQWTGGTGATDYWLSVGTAPFAQGGGSHLYDADQGLNLSHTVSGLPSDGSALYVRLYTYVNGGWLFNDYVYTATCCAALTPAQLTTPPPASTLTASTVQFQWTGGTGATDYWLSIGTTAGGSNLYDADQGLALSRTVSNLPTNGSTIYVRLYSYIAGAWQFHDYTYQAVTVVTQAALTTPPPSSTLSATTVQFQWTGGTGATDYWLSIGTTAGGSNLYDADQGLALSRTVSSLPANGSTIYVRLYSYINGAWQFTDYTYTSPGP
jgi:hypothetical protein